MKSIDNDIYIMIITVTAVLLILLIFIVSFLFIYKNRQLRHLLEIDSVKEKYNQEILRAELEIKEQTLKNISEEIHDNVGQVLSLAVLNLSALNIEETDKALAKIEQTTRLVEKAVADLRNLSKSLDADNLANLGLAAMIKYEMEILEKTGMYKTVYNITGTEKHLDANKELVLYRIVQESLNNIIKHSGALCITINLNYNESHLELLIIDNGKGFDISSLAGKTPDDKSAGIKNMKKRANLIGAAYKIESIPKQGTTVNIRIDLQH